MASTFLLRLLLLLLGFTHLLLCINAVPLTRTRSLMFDSHGNEILSHNMHLANNRDKRWMGNSINIIGRMNIELNDYPGSGANNRHTPKHCADC